MDVKGYGIQDKVELGTLILKKGNFQRKKLTSLWLMNNFFTQTLQFLGDATFVTLVL